MSKFSDQTADIDCPVDSCGGTVTLELQVRPGADDSTLMEISGFIHSGAPDHGKRLWLVNSE